jgi:hypothetical protein
MSHAKAAVSLAGGVISIALIEALISKGLMTKADGLAVLRSAQDRCIDLGEPAAARVCATLNQHITSD